MVLPLLLHGNYNEVLKKVNKLKKDCKGDIELITSRIEKLEMCNIRQEDMIIMVDGYVTRRVRNSFFPFAFPNVFLFEERIKCSEIVKWYKEEALKKEWMFLSLITRCSPTQYLFDNIYTKYVLKSLINFWVDLTSVGAVYINNIEHCLMTKNTIENSDGLNLWEKSLVFKRMFRLIGFNEEDVDSDIKILNIINGLLTQPGTPW
jgi:hypothetical protein